MSTEEQNFYLQALNSYFATIEFDSTGKIIGANQNFLDAMGYTLQEVQGKHHRIFCDPAYTQTDEYSQFWRDLAEGKSFTNEYARLNKNNDVVWIQATYNALKNEKGEVTKIIKIGQVITDRKLKVAEQEAKLDAINKSMGAIEFNMDGTVITANENFLNVIDYSLDEVKGIHHRKFVSDELANSEEYKNFWQDLNNGVFKTGVFERVAKDGHKVFIQATYNPVNNLKGQPFKVVKFASDITENKFMDAEYHSKLDAAGKLIGMIEFNMDGTVITANDNFLSVLGYSLDEVKGVHHSQFVKTEYSKSAEYKNFWASLNRGEFLNGEFFRIGKGGKETWLSASYNPIFNFEGIPYKVVKFATDITQAKKDEIEVARFTNMVKKSRVAILYATPDGILTYFNESAEKLLTDLESHLPAPKNELVGQSIDWFHKDPNKVQKIIADPSNLPHQALISIGDEKLSLLISAVLDQNDMYMGAMVNVSVITDKFGLVKELTGNSEAMTKQADTLLATANNLSAAAEETSAQANTASSASEEINTGMQSVATNMEEMLNAIKEITKVTNSASDKSSEAMKLATNTNQIITKLGDSSMDIGNVIKVISSIAQQTNLLALNATIEAARAGDAGKGFAVVANEVKELAKQTARATNEITQKIENIQTDSRSAVSAIGDISEVVKQLNVFAGNVAASVEEQAATTSEVVRIVSESAEGVNQITENITQVSSAAQGTGRDAMATQKSAKELGDIVNKLKKQIEKIDLF